jgi:hypothetical protein
MNTGELKVNLPFNTPISDVLTIVIKSSDNNVNRVNSLYSYPFE